MNETTFLKFRCFKCDFIIYVEDTDNNIDHSCTQCNSILTMQLEYITKLEEK